VEEELEVGLPACLIGIFIHLLLDIGFIPLLFPRSGPIFNRSLFDQHQQYQYRSGQIRSIMGTDLQMGFLFLISTCGTKKIEE